jgi:Abnormal spindle-like microcephaly-assoc'd, ASPM-SPD-2-Hydin
MKARRVIQALVGVALFLAAEHAALAKRGPGKPSPTATPAAKQAAALVNALEGPSESYVLRYPNDWSPGPASFTNAKRLIARPTGYRPASPGTEPAWMLIATEAPKNYAEGLRRLRDIASEVPGTANFLKIGGWPALERRVLKPLEQPSGQDEGDEPEKMSLRITTAVAAGDLIVRVETWVVPPDSELAEKAEAIGRSLTFPRITEAPINVDQEIRDLQSGSGREDDVSAIAPPASGGEPMSIAPASIEDSTGATLRVQGPADGTDAEIEVAVSGNGQTVIIGNNSRDFATSTDGGKTFPTTGTIAVPAGFFAANGDPSLAWGQSGTFYYAYIGFPDTNASNARDECSTAVHSSATGANFNNFVANAVYCNDAGPACFPDQEHIAADRVNAAPGGDQIYSVWRHFGGTCANAAGSTPSIVCSQNGGVNWTAVAMIAGAAGGDFPRVTVGQDGFVYVVWVAGGNIVLQKYSSCANGLVAQFGVPTTVGPATPVGCPVPGVDRCNGRNTLASPMAAVDDTNPNHVYVAYATNTVAGNENVLVRDSTDGGATFPAARVAQLNTGIAAPRFMPWVCTTGGEAFVTWYDRRAATPCPAPPCLTPNDTTEFFGGSAFLDGGGNLAAGPEFRISDITDAQCCASGTNAACPNAWPTGVNAMTDSEGCWAQPQLGGRCGTVTPCCLTTGPTPDSAQPCDFSTGPACPGAETCRVGRGQPKYGDYNGNVCAAGRLIAAWASSTSPPGINPASTDIDVFVSVELVGDVPVITVPGNISFPDTCVGATSTATLNVCNTGTANLEVTSITDNSAQFAVTTPSSGYPVVISPDFCFPFQVTFSPTSEGPQTATITINSNDPINPSVQVQASGTGTVPDVRVSGSTAFGDVCAGAQAEKIVNVCNVGGCNLNVISAEFVPPCPDFTLINNPFPAPVSPDFCAPLTIRFTPTSAGPKVCTLRITTDDPDTPVIDLIVTGNTPAAAIDVPPSMSFPPEVIQSVGACTTEQPFPISNTGTCPLVITDISLGGENVGDYAMSGLPSFPIILEPGHIVGEGDFEVVFAPTVVDRDRLGNLTVTWVSDPITGTPAQVTRDLCGEGVRTGARVLVTSNGVPLATVEQIHLQRLTANRNKNRLDSQDVAKNLALQTIDPDGGGICPQIQFHREYGGLSNPIMLAPGSYVVTVTGIVNGRRAKKTVGFDVQTCDFNQNINVDLP